MGQTTCLGWSKQLVMTIPAVSFVILFKETATCKRIHAERTHKVFWMPFLIVTYVYQAKLYLVQSTDNTTCDRFSTPSTQGTKLHMIMCFTVRLALVFKKHTSSKRFTTICTGKMFRMPLKIGLDCKRKAHIPEHPKH